MHRSKTSIQTSGTWSDKPGNNSAQLSSLNDIPVCVFSTHLIWAQASERKAFPVLSVLLCYFTKSLMVKAVQVYVREELWTFLGWTIFLLVGCGFFFRFVTWLSFQSGTNWGCSLLCQLNTMIKLCLSLIRCLNSVFVSIWKGKTRNRSTQVFWYEEDKTIFTGFPEYNFIKADTSEWRFFKMYILITWKKCNKTCAWRFMGTPNFTKMNINIYIWTIQS